MAQNLDRSILLHFNLFVAGNRASQLDMSWVSEIVRYGLTEVLLDQVDIHLLDTKRDILVDKAISAINNAEQGSSAWPITPLTL